MEYFIRFYFNRIYGNIDGFEIGFSVIDIDERNFGLVLIEFLV